MSAEIITLNANGEDLYPRTSIDAVLNEDGTLYKNNLPPFKLGIKKSIYGYYDSDNNFHPFNQVSNDNYQLIFHGYTSRIAAPIKSNYSKMFIFSSRAQNEGTNCWPIVRINNGENINKGLVTTSKTSSGYGLSYGIYPISTSNGDILTSQAFNINWGTCFLLTDDKSRYHYLSTQNGSFTLQKDTNRIYMFRNIKISYTLTMTINGVNVPLQADTNGTNQNLAHYYEDGWGTSVWFANGNFKAGSTVNITSGNEYSQLLIVY